MSNSDPPQTDMIAPTGTIKDLSIPWLLQDIRRERLSGTAVFSRETEQRTVYFKEGDILFASSNATDERLGEFLLRKGKLTQEQFDRSSETVVRTGKKLGAVLFEMSAISAHDLVAQVKLQVRDIILKLFSWRDGAYLFNKGVLPPTDIIPLQMSTGDLIIDGVRDLDWKPLRKSLPSLGTVLRPATDPANLFQKAHLDPDQQSVLALIDGTKKIQDICLSSGIGDFNTLKAIYVLLALRMIEPGAVTAGEEQLAREAAKSAAAEQAEDVTALDPETRKKMLRDAYDSLVLQDYFQMLNVGRGATQAEIKKAYFHLAKVYHPDRHFDPEMNDMKDILSELFTRIHEAYETLSSPQKRDKYTLDLVNGRIKFRVQEAQPKAQKQDNKDAALVQYNEGMKRFSQNNFWGAEEAFQWAMRLDPGNAEYVFRRGLTLSRIPRRGHEAEEYYVKAIEMAPSKMEYHLELGSFYARTGLKAKARRVFTDALQRNPNADKVKSALERLGP
jgi:tetratricopeptide (TPR) repeat protein